MSDAAFYSAIASSEKIDADKGVIYGVSVITIGEAAGKNSGTWIDSTTLSQIHSVASKFRDGVKVKISMSKEHDGSIGQVCGVLKNFRTEGQHERADFHLLKSDENYSKILEMSASMPSEFGFSIVLPRKIQKVDGRDCLRCEDIYSVDLVEQPAANPSGLFSKTTMNDQIKFAADGKTHDKECECKECMSAKNKKEMSALIADQIALAIKGITIPDTASLSAKLTDLETKLTAYDKTAEVAALSAKKGEIAGLVADATREGKVIPLTDDDLAKMEIPVIKAMFSKLVPNQVKLSGVRTATPPKAADGKPVEFKTVDERIAFCQSKQQEGAARLTADFLANPALQLSAN